MVKISKSITGCVQHIYESELECSKTQRSACVWWIFYNERIVENEIRIYNLTVVFYKLCGFVHTILEFHGGNWKQKVHVPFSPAFEWELRNILIKKKNSVYKICMSVIIWNFEPDRLKNKSSLNSSSSISIEFFCQQCKYTGCKIFTYAMCEKYDVFEQG